MSEWPQRDMTTAPTSSPLAFGGVMSRLFANLLLLATCWMAGSCTLPRVAPQAAVPGNQIIVRGQNPELVWEKAVDVLHAYHFEIQRENKLNGEIETHYLTGSSLLEPWHSDSVGFGNRLESTLQSIRRKVLLRVFPSTDGYVVSVEAIKEIEFVGGTANNTPGVGTFLSNAPTQRDVNIVAGRPAPAGWMPRGRDLALEQSLACSLQEAFGG